MAWYQRAEPPPIIAIELPAKRSRFRSLGAAASASVVEQAAVERYLAGIQALNARFEELTQYRRLNSVRPAVAYKAFNM